MKREDRISRENRKAMGPFLFILVVCLLAGAALGLLVVSLWEQDAALTVGDVLYEVFGHISGGLTVGLSAGCLLVAIHFYRKARAILADWDGEDDAVYQKGDQLLTMGMMTSSVAQILAFLFFGISLGLLYSLLDLCLALVGLIFTIVWVIRYQQLTVDLVRRMNPEKEGSVYEVNFQKRWLNSCDEAERQQIGEASAFAFQKVNGIVCPILWMIAFLTALVFDSGPLPTVMVSLVWLSLTVLYQWKCVQISKRGAQKRESL